MEYTKQQFGGKNVTDPCTATMICVSFCWFTTAMAPARSETIHCSEEDIKLADHIRRYLDAHYTESIVLADVAAAFGCSESYIPHTFKRCIGYSPIQYMIRRRIGLAQTYLITTDYTATHIATLVGYDNTNYFNTIFTKITGVSPMRYKKQYLDAMRGKALP